MNVLLNYLIAVVMVLIIIIWLEIASLNGNKLKVAKLKKFVKNEEYDKNVL